MMMFCFDFADFHTQKHATTLTAPPRSSSQPRTWRISFFKRIDVLRSHTASDAALAACWTAHQLQIGHADVQGSADVIFAVSESAHLVAPQRTQHSIVVRPTAVHAISTDIICKTIVQHCRPLTWNSLARAVLNCDSLFMFKSRLKTDLFATAFC